MILENKISSDIFIVGFTSRFLILSPQLMLSVKLCPATGLEAAGTLQHGRVYLDLRKHIIGVRVTQHRARLPREVVEPLSVELFQSCLDTVLGSGLAVALLK